MPFALKLAWLNLALIVGWFLVWVLLGGAVRATLTAFIPLFLLGGGILLFVDWASRREGEKDR